MQRVVTRGCAIVCGLLSVSAMCAVPTTATPDTAAWDGLLQRHVKVVGDGHASRVDYAGMRADRDTLDRYTDALSKITQAQFKAWDKPAQMAFLINAYNAFTVKLILTKWPQLKSIKDLGGWLSSPWKLRFFTLLGQRTTLDETETKLREPGQYDDPRIHFAINCASIGCPMLQAHAYHGATLDAQLDQATDDFLADHSRNRYDASKNVLMLSKIFDWYADDFSRRGSSSLNKFLAAHATQISTAPGLSVRIANGDVKIEYLPYDWQLNTVQPP